MLRLQTFGGLSLVDETGGTVALKRRRLAVLGLLAVAGDRGVTREKVAACLWPESPEEQARHALDQLLHSVRQHLPTDPFVGPHPLRLNPVVVASDVGSFEAGLASGALAEAVRLYRGPFLDGFYLDNASAFERWSESERNRLAGEYMRALHRLARQAGEQGRHTVEIDWWQQLAAVDPLNERNVLGLARAMVEAGDQAGALQQAQAFDARVRQELGMAPTPDLEAFIDGLRKERPASAPPVNAVGQAGQTPARYRIERELGRGSTAVVYLGRDLKLDRPVAMKVLRPELALSIEAKRFLREIAILARLHHPHILQVYDSGMVSLSGRPASPYYVMPYVRGESLRERLSEEVQLPVETALEITRQLAGALSAAHGEGVIHRDIKPGNILLEAGQALLADFGVAHALDTAGGEQLSRSGFALGTPGYMSPELARGEGGADERGDIYSLACVLYEMVAGEPPFTGRTPQAILARQASGEVPSIRTLCPGLAPPVEAAIMRGLAIQPAARFATAAEFALALG
jgi:DNA-binding SARP family transcriptional activator